MRCFSGAGGKILWHYECNGRAVGPVSQDAIEILIRDGVLFRSSLVWKQGMSDWKEADQTELNNLFTTPPPLKPNEPDTKAEPYFIPGPQVPTSGSEKSGLQAKVASAGNSEEPNAELHAAQSRAGRVNILGESGAGDIKRLREIVAHANFAVLFFVVASIATILADASSIFFVGTVLDGGFASDLEMNRQASIVDSLSQITAIAFLLIFIWSAIVIGRWTYRAMNNLREMGYETTVSPGWTIGWHFIPVALLWMPFRGMAQIWRGSVYGAPMSDGRLPGAMRFWWATWLLGNWLSFGAFRMQESGFAMNELDVVQMALGVGIVASGLHIVSAILLLGIMKRVTEAQDVQPAIEFE
ncbi:MAG: DUF4328 domain-containing protein [Hyphomonas sp.]